MNKTSTPEHQNISKDSEDTEVLIVGGGLSGLALAYELQQAGIDYIVTEAKSSLGGRIKTERINHGAFDLGPAWFWPCQPRMEQFTKHYDLKVFDQFSQGEVSFQDVHGKVFRGKGFASMEGSYRIQGGMQTLIDSLGSVLSPEKIKLKASVKQLENTQGQLVATLADTTKITAQHVALAIPPRVATQLSFTPELPQQAMTTMENIPTWMAGQAKFVAVYDTAFWRESGLSGDAMSRSGPMLEIHDACDPASGVAALFGFIGIPAQAREGRKDAITNACINQLALLFGDQAKTPQQIFLQDWAQEEGIATESDFPPMTEHPTYGLPNSLKTLWQQRLHLSSTETAPQFGGYLEGALEAAQNTAQKIIHSLR